jgi:hypothetical protein
VPAFDVGEQLRQRPFDCCELIETDIAGVELLDQSGDEALQACRRGGAFGCELYPFDAVDQTLDQRLQLDGHIGAVSLARLELVDKHGDPALEHGQDPAVGAPLRVIQLGAEGADLSDSFASASGDAAWAAMLRIAATALPKLLEDRWVPGARDNLNLARGLLHHARHAEEAFSRP